MTCRCLTERLLIGPKESNETNKQKCGAKIDFGCLSLSPFVIMFSICHNFVSTQYLENNLIEFYHIL